MRIQYNFVKPHMALDGQTPSEASGINIKGTNKWLTLIQNASKSRTTNLAVNHYIPK